MEFISIFVGTVGKLFAVHYPNEDTNVFDKLMSQWTDTEYLKDFFLENSEELKQDPWKGISIDKAVNKVLDEADNFYQELSDIEENPQDNGVTLKDIFKPLHQNMLSATMERQKKGKPDPGRFQHPMLRLYALELEDGCYVITGGCIKLTRAMIGPLFEAEKNNLRRVQQFLKSENITDKEGLITT